MLSNYLKITWRNLQKQKLYAAINLSGMTIGLTCIILVALYIQFESSYDQQHSKYEHIYRVSQVEKGNTFRGTDKFAVSPVPIGPELCANFPEVQHSATFSILPLDIQKKEEIISYRGLFADTGFLKIFDHESISGDLSIQSFDKNTIILSKSFADIHFPNTNPIGQTISTTDEKSYIVKAVIEDIPTNQHFSYDFIVAIENYDEYVRDKQRWNWSSNNYWTYILLDENADYKKINGQMSIFEPEIMKAYANVPFHSEFYLEPLSDIYLKSKANFQPGKNGNQRNLYLAGTLGLLVLFLALTNYVNLATTRYRQRSKEIGMRKVLGASRNQLIIQFVSESFAITIISSGIALALAYLLLPTFNDLLDADIYLDFRNSQFIVGAFVIISLLLGGFSGLYPALLSSKLDTIDALQSTWLKFNRDGKLISNLVVIGQFAIAMTLCASSIIVLQQIKYIKHKNLGLNQDQVAFVNYRNQDVFEKIPAIKNELLSHPSIHKVSVSEAMPINSSNAGLLRNWEGRTGTEEHLIYRFRADQDFVDIFEMNIYEGRNLSQEYGTDSSSYLINEATSKMLGWEDAVGKSFADGRVVGVVRDFHFQPLTNLVNPMFISLRNPQYAYYGGNFIIKLDGLNKESAENHIKDVLSSFMPTMPLEVQYVDRAFDQLYRSEQNLAQAFQILTMLALFLGAMGLLGLVSHKVASKTKEIGIRKVLGAKVLQILTTITQDFISLLLIACAIAIPITWFLMSKWLNNFAYNIQISIWVFVLASTIIISLALVVIISQSLKAALVNPINTLKNE